MLPPMKILLVQKLPYIPTLSGASRTNRTLLGLLTKRKHSCRVVGLASFVRGPEGRHLLGASMYSMTTESKSTRSATTMTSAHGWSSRYVNLHRLGRSSLKTGLISASRPH